MEKRKDLIDLGLITGIVGGILVAKAIMPEIALALPWDGPLEELKENLTGTVATSVAALICLGVGAMYAAGESQGMGKIGVRIIIGLSIALGATAFVSFIKSSIGN